MRVSAPGSTANIGPGFDCLALAIDRRFDLADEPVEGFAPVAADDLVWTAVGMTGVAFDRLWFRSDIPVGRGLGSSAAACVAAAYLGYRCDGVDAAAALDSAFAVAAQIEEHPDNAAAAAYGGLNLAVAGRIHTRRPAIADGQLFVWVPSAASLTKRARAVVGERFALGELIDQAAACAATYAGLLTGSWELLAGAHHDAIHETQRLASLPESRAVLESLRAEGHIAWLSGSGPSVAALIESGGERTVPAAAGEWWALQVDNRGCREVA